jgi:hypothetical protein
MLIIRNMDNLLEPPIKKYWHLWNIFEKIYMSINFFTCFRKNLKIEDLEINKKYYIEYNGSFDKYNKYFSKFFRIPYTLETGIFVSVTEIQRLQADGACEKLDINNGLIQTKVGFTDVKLLYGEPYGLNLIPDIDDIYTRESYRYNFYSS